VQAPEAAGYRKDVPPSRSGIPRTRPVSTALTGWSAEMIPMSGDNEKHTSASERNACDDRSRRPHLEGRDLSGDEPDTCKQDQQETDLGESYARLMAESKLRNNGSYFGLGPCRMLLGYGCPGCADPGACNFREHAFDGRATPRSFPKSCISQVTASASRRSCCVGPSTPKMPTALDT
jgi:hypothetical protein